MTSGNSVRESNRNVLTYKWKVNNYSDYNIVGQCLSSPRFSITNSMNSVQWRLNLYPNGTQYAYKDYLSIFLEYFSEINVTARVKISILDVEQNIAVFERTFIQEQFRKGLEPCGDKKFISRSFFNNCSSRVLENDTITILCKIIVLSDLTPLVSLINTFSSRKFDKFEQLLETGKFSDVTLSVGEMKFRLHKVILTSCSPVFRAMFEHDMIEKQSNVIDILNVRYEVMKEIIRFMYTNKVNEIDGLAVELLVAADMYEIVELKDLCERNLSDCLCIDTAIERLILAITYNANVLKNNAIEFIVRNLEDFLNQAQFQILESSVFIEILTFIAKKKIIV